MNHVKCIFNTSVPRRVSSSSGIPQRSSCRNEGSFKKRSAKLRSPSINNSSLILAVKKVYPLLVQRHFDDTRLGDNGKEMLCGTQGSKSKSIANSVRRLLSDRKLPLQHIDGIASKQAVRFGSSSCLSYDRTINYDDDRDSRSYAQMITAYNETMLTVDNASSIFQDRSNSKLNVQLSKTLFKTTSTLTSSAYNFENVSIKENTERTSMTDMSYAINTIIDNDDDIYEEKMKNLDVYSPNIIPKTNVRSYASIIADYSAAMDINSIMSKYKNDFPKMSNVSVSPSQATTLETPQTERNVSEFVSSPDLSENSRKKMHTNEELEWLRKVDKILNDLKTATGKTSTKDNQKISDFKENNVLECVTEQAVWVDKSTLVSKKKSNVVTPRQTEDPKDQAEETQNREARAEKSDKTPGLQTSHASPASSNLDSTSKKDWTQMPKSTETNISGDPQVELRMVPSGNESIVSVNVEAIAKAMESRSPDSKELSVIVSSNNKETMKPVASKENVKEGNPNFGSMRISISEESLPVKELELSINGKLISDVRSIKARTETLNVMTSMDKVEIRVPYLQSNPGKTNPATKSFVKNVKSAESVLKLRIATAFDGTYPILTTGVTKNVQAQSTIQPSTSTARYAHTEGSKTNKKMSEAPSATKNQPSREPSVKITEKTDSKSSKKTLGYNVSQDKSEEPAWAKIKNKYLGPNTSKTFGDVKRSDASGDIDLRHTKTFGPTIKTKDTGIKTDAKIATETKKDNPGDRKTATDSRNMESSKDVKSTSEKDGIQSLASLIIKHSGRSSDGSSSAASGKPKVDSNPNRESSKPPGNKRDSKATDEAMKKSALNAQSSQTDMFDQRISSKWSPWWSSSDTYVKLKKEEDYHRSSWTPTDVTEKQKTRKFDSTNEVPPKTTKESSRASEEEKTLFAKSQDLSKSKERKYEIKESTRASSKVHDAEGTLKSPFKSESIIRHDSPCDNERSKRHSFSSRTKITEEKLNKRNEGPSKKETRNTSALKVAESWSNVDTNNEVKVPIEETPKIETTLKSAKNQAQENIVGVKSKDDEKAKNEKLIHQKASFVNGFPEKHLNMQQNVNKIDPESSVTKPTKSASNLSKEDARLKDILNFMKPIEKKKDGTLIDYGVKVASRKKPEKLKDQSKSNIEMTDVTKDKKTVDERLDSQDDITTSYTVQRISMNMQNPIKCCPGKVEFKEEDKAKKETVSAKDKDVNEDKSPVNFNEILMNEKESSSKPTNVEKVAVKNESLNERITKVLERAKEQIPYQSVIKAPPNVNVAKEVEKSNKDSKELNSGIIKPEKVAASDKSLNEPISKSYQNVIKESSKCYFKKEESANVKKVERKSDENIRKPFERTVTSKPSKLSSTSVTSDTSTTESFPGTIVRHSSKDSEKRKPNTVSYKHSTDTIKSSLNAIEKPNNPPSTDIFEIKTNKNEGDSSGSQNNPMTPSSPINTSSSSSPKTTKSNTFSSNSIDLEKSSEFNKLRCQEKNKQSNVKSAEESIKLKRPEKELVYSVWLQRSKEKADDKKP